MATLVPDALVTDVIEARVRRLMSQRAALPDAWPHRGKRAELKVEIQAQLDEYLALTK